jgi:homoserine kinase
MSEIESVSIRVPATTANLGPGFDCLGAALTLYNTFDFARSPAPETIQIEVTGVEAEQVQIDSSNLAYHCFHKLYQTIGQTPPSVKLTIALGFPLASGLGSSATAIVGGLVGANLLAGSPLSQEEVMQLAIAIERHPDNVVPALLGGCRLAVPSGNHWTICEIPWHPEVVPILAIPNFKLSTQSARQVLPQTYSRTDAIFSLAHLGLLLRGLETGRGDWLRVALQDRIHQPYRQPLIQGYEEVQTAAIAAGAYGLVISGAGPTVLALAHPAQCAEVEVAIVKAWSNQNIAAQTHVLQINTEGVVFGQTRG